MTTLWHKGEVEMQRRAGVGGQMDAMGRRMVRDQMADPFRRFFGSLPFVVAAAIDRDGDVWATLLAGLPGFMHSPDPHALQLAPQRDERDLIYSALADGASIGLLGIDLLNRRRSRLNGKISRLDSTSFDVQVLQSYGNCSQYIQQRSFNVMVPASGDEPEWGTSLLAMSARARELVALADTFFVGSYAAGEGIEPMVDVSHKGGWPGFLRQDPDGGLTIPDFSGNLFFNTLGNLLINPRCGLVFADFETGDMLQLVGDATVPEVDPDLRAFPGAERLWRCKPRKIVLRRGAFTARAGKGPSGVR